MLGLKMVDCGTRIVCEPCLEGKMDRLPFPQQSIRKTTHLLEIVHTDLCGPMSNNEFVNENLKQFYQNEGIEMQLTAFCRTSQPIFAGGGFMYASRR